MLGPANEGARQSVKFLGMSGLRISGMVSNSCYSYSYLLLYRVLSRKLVSRNVEPYRNRCRTSSAVDTKP